MKVRPQSQKSHVNIKIFLINVENIPTADLDLEQSVESVQFNQIFCAIVVMPALN